MAHKDDPRMLATLHAWNRAMSDRLGIDEIVDEDVTETYLALTGAAAHEVVRPAAPFAAMFAGWLYGSGRAGSLEEAAMLVGEALRETAPEDPEGAGDDEDASTDDGERPARGGA